MLIIARKVSASFSLTGSFYAAIILIFLIALPYWIPSLKSTPIPPLLQVYKQPCHALTPALGAVLVQGASLPVHLSWFIQSVQTVQFAVRCFLLLKLFSS